MNIRKIHFKSTWALRHKVMWPDREVDYIKLPNDEQGLHYGLFVNEELISIISAFIIGKEAQFRKFATLNDTQGKGYGSKLLNHLFLELANMGVTKIWCNARTEKAHFYSRFGMKKTEKRFKKGGIYYEIMEKNI